MDKIEKFLKRLSKKNFKSLMNETFPKIRSLDLKGLDLKPLTGYKGLYRVKVGKIRIIFFKDTKQKRGIIVAIDHRGKIYKQL